MLQLICALSVKRRMSLLHFSLIVSLL
jgi:hypothetical protein